MSTRLDPRTKQQIKQALEGAMYAPTERRNEKKLHNLIVENSTRAGYNHLSFSYKGEYYNMEITQLRYKTQRLVPELQSSMDEYLAEKKHIEYTEKPYIIGFFNKMLNTSNSVLDYYQLLPGCIHRPLAQLNLPPEYILPREMTDDQVEAFRLEHAKWILMLKKRMVLDLVMT